MPPKAKLLLSAVRSGSGSLVRPASGRSAHGWSRWGLGCTAPARSWATTATASTRPAADRQWPVRGLVELTRRVSRPPNTLCREAASVSSPRTEPVPCALT